MLFNRPQKIFNEWGVKQLWAWFAMACLAAFIPGCQSSPNLQDNTSAAAPPAGGEHFFILYNNDLWAYLEPCGCRVQPIGGMRRRWSATQDFPKDYRLSLDAGNVFFPSTQASPFLISEWREQAKATLESYNLLGWDALTPGENDFALGLKELKKLEKEAKFAFVSANIVYRKNNRPVFRQRLILERHGRKFGIFGIFHPRLSLPQELIAQDPIKVAQEEVAMLRKQGVNMVIALSHQGLQFDEELAEAVPGIDLIIGAQSLSYLQAPKKIGATNIVQLNSKGQVFAYLDYGFKNDQPEMLDSKVIELDVSYEYKSSNAKNPMRALVEMLNIKIADINHEKSAQLWQEKHKSISPTYSTYVNCQTCHMKQAEFQNQQPHAAAFLTLLAQKKERALDCLQCHSLAMHAADGFSSLEDAIRSGDNKNISYKHVLQMAGLQNLPGTKISFREDPSQIKSYVEKWNLALKKLNVKHSFLGVQCENCHGSKPGHPFSSAKANGIGKVKPISCLQCHSPDQMPAWYSADRKPLLPVIEAAMKKIACPP